MTTPPPANPIAGASTGDEAEVHALFARVLEAWNAGDATAFAAPFSDDATYVGFDGSVMRGRDEIRDAHADLFAKWLKGTRLVADAVMVRLRGPDAAVVVAAGGTIMRGRAEPAPARDSIQTLAAERRSDGWSFVAFQNTRIRPIGGGLVSVMLWLIPDMLWALFFRLRRISPRSTVELGGG
jgi:uncharacterized protein (TIGR02246 family)